MTHEERVHHHIYETCEGIQEHAERIVGLEELVADLNRACGAMCERTRCDDCVLMTATEGCGLNQLQDRTLALGIEV